MSSRPPPILTQSDTGLSIQSILLKKTIPKKALPTKKKCKFFAYTYKWKKNKLKRNKYSKDDSKDTNFLLHIDDIEKNSNFKIINKGMFGEIYLNDDKVCVKVIEFNNIKKLDYHKNKTSYLLKKTKEIYHENIIKFKNYGYMQCIPHEFKLYIQTEYINGKILVCYFQEINPLLCLKQICEGLHHLQEKYEFIHNDIKSSNIMAIIYSESDLTIKIIDIDGGDSIKNLKKSKEIFGTPLYFSPEKLLLCSSFKKEFNDFFKPNTSFEILHDSEKINYLKKQDIYSIGVILFELIFGINIHIQIGTFVKFPGDIKKFYFTKTKRYNAYDAFIHDDDNKENYEKLKYNLSKYNYSTEKIETL